MADQPTRCPSCQGGRLSHGKILGHGLAFVPASWGFFRLRLPYPVRRGFVCLDCGCVGQYLDDQALEKLRIDETPEPKPKAPLDDV